MKKLLAVLALLVCSFAAQAADLLYADDGKSLFVLDQTTGAKTFVSDGTLRWICSPAFDEAHHTRFWAAGNSYIYGNPFTGQIGTAPWSISFTFQGEPEYCVSDPVYVPTTGRLYAISSYWLFVDDGATMIMPIAYDQFNGPPINYWGGSWSWDFPFEHGWITSVAFDPSTGNVAFAGAGQVAGDVTQNGYGIMFFDPLMSASAPEIFVWHEQPSGQNVTQASITSMAFEPTTGDIYYVRGEQAFVGLADTPWTLRRWDRALGQDFEICTLDQPLQLRFASEEYVR
jgi:hypothetical protein